jgi:hypothetical protein
MTIDCKHCGERKPRERAMALGEWDEEVERSDAKGGERTCR